MFLLSYNPELVCVTVLNGGTVLGFGAPCPTQWRVYPPSWRRRDAGADRISPSEGLTVLGVGSPAVSPGGPVLV